MNRRAHARHARRLIEACGGLLEAAEACRVGKSALADYQNPHGEGFMPADVIADLEADCGQRIYSRALFEEGSDACEARDLKDAASEATEEVVSFQRRVRLATADGVITPSERERMMRDQARAEEKVRGLGHLLSKDAG